MSEKTMSAKELYESKETFGFVPTKTECINLMEAYHAHELAAIRKAVEGLGYHSHFFDNPPSQRGKETLLLNRSEVLAILDAHKPKA